MVGDRRNRISKCDCLCRGGIPANTLRGRRIVAGEGLRRNGIGRSVLIGCRRASEPRAVAGLIDDVIGVAVQARGGVNAGGGDIARHGEGAAAVAAEAVARACGIADAERIAVVNRGAAAERPCGSACIGRGGALDGDAVARAGVPADGVGKRRPARGEGDDVPDNIHFGSLCDSCAVRSEPAGKGVAHPRRDGQLTDWIVGIDLALTFADRTAIGIKLEDVSPNLPGCVKRLIAGHDHILGDADRLAVFVLDIPAIESAVFKGRDGQRAVGLTVWYDFLRFFELTAVCIKGDHAGGHHLLKFFVIDYYELTTDKGQKRRICQFPANQIVSGQPQLADDTGVRLLKGDIPADDGVASLRAQLNRSEQGKLGVLCVQNQRISRTVPDGYTAQCYFGRTELERCACISSKDHIADFGFCGIRFDLQILVYGAVADQEELLCRIADFDRLIVKAVRTIREIQRDPLCAGMGRGHGDCGVGCIDGDFRDIFKGVLSE